MALGRQAGSGRQELHCKKPANPFLQQVWQAGTDRRESAGRNYPAGIGREELRRQELAGRHWLTGTDRQEMRWQELVGRMWQEICRSWRLQTRYVLYNLATG
jgi:hypothetical protein